MKLLLQSPQVLSCKAMDQQSQGVAEMDQGRLTRSMSIQKKETQK